MENTIEVWHEQKQGCSSDETDHSLMRASKQLSVLYVFLMPSSPVFRTHGRWGKCSPGIRPGHSSFGCFLTQTGKSSSASWHTCVVSSVTFTLTCMSLLCQTAGRTPGYRSTTSHGQCHPSVQILHQCLYGLIGLHMLEVNCLYNDVKLCYKFYLSLTNVLYVNVEPYWTYRIYIFISKLLLRFILGGGWGVWTCRMLLRIRWCELLLP